MSRGRSARRLRATPRRVALVTAILLVAVSLGLTLGLRMGPSDSSEIVELSDVELLTLWNASDPVEATESSDSSSVVLGVRFHSDVPGTVQGLRFYRPSPGDGPFVGSLWTETGRSLGQLTVTDDSTQWGWRRGSFDKPVRIEAGRTYIASYRAEHGHYASQRGYFADGREQRSGPLTATAGVFTYDAAGFPNREWEKSNYFVDVEFRPSRGSSPHGSTSPSTNPSTGVPTTTGSPQPTTTGPAQPAAPSTEALATTPNPGTGSVTTAGAPAGWPGPGNTGVRAGVELRKIGSITVQTDGAVVSNLDIEGNITINARNVTIRNVRVHGCGNPGAINVGYSDNGYGPVLIEDVEVSGDGLNCERFGVGAANMTIRRANIHGYLAGIYADRDVTVENSWIHGMFEHPEAHMDGFLSNGGSNFTLVGNNIECAVPSGRDNCSAAIGMFGDFSPIENVLMERNLFNTQGGYCVYGGSTSGKPYPIARNVRIVNNHFGRRYNEKCGMWGTVTSFEPGNGNVMSGNVWADTGQPVTY